LGIEAHGHDEGAFLIARRRQKRSVSAAEAKILGISVSIIFMKPPAIRSRSFGSAG
jgi:hypothetical protein